MSSSLKLEPSVDLLWISALHVVIYYISSFKEEGWKYSCRFVFVSFTLQYKLHEKLIIKNILFTKSPHFLLRGKAGQLSKRKRVLCWSIDIISLWLYLNGS